jgi:exoribonuclease R
MGDAMHGDHVLASIERRKRFATVRAAPKGRILRVIDRAHATVVGLFRYGSRGNTVAPYESRLLQEIIIPPGEELTPELQGKLGRILQGAACGCRNSTARWSTWS